jgi:hypothetical protein
MRFVSCAGRTKWPAGKALTVALSLALTISWSSLASAQSFRLVEYSPWLTKNTGPEKSKGVIYYIRGWGFQTRKGPRGGYLIDDFQTAPYFMKSLSEAGWDVIAGKYPNVPVAGRSSEFVDRAAAYVSGRVRELKKMGYRRVVLSGQSWGGWISLLVARGQGPGPDALLLTAPTTWGTRVLLSGKPNPNFTKGITQLRPLLEAVRVPTVLSVFANDPFEAGERGLMTREILTRKKIPHLVLNKPAGFGGHTSASLPVFDYAFGACIRRLIDDSDDAPCLHPPLRNDDFRSIVSISQIPDANDRLISSSDSLVGGKFVVFALGSPNRFFEYQRSTRTVVTAEKKTQERFVFRNGLHCGSGTCSRLVRWSSSEILEFDSKAEYLRGWWVKL